MWQYKLVQLENEQKTSADTDTEGDIYKMVNKTRKRQATSLANRSMIKLSGVITVMDQNKNQWQHWMTENWKKASPTHGCVMEVVQLLCGTDNLADAGLRVYPREMKAAWT